MATMSPRDLVLTDQSDDNFVSTVLGKIRVLRQKPLNPSSSEAESSNVPKGAFVCRYDLSFCPTKSSGGKEAMVVKLLPCADEASGNEGIGGTA